uniref:LOW QUALITY PROTEIN: WUSCHEL-related homeobox 8-like n=1 Tax=Erigeron canadensis TaxID=72917 RepID=UPI001CB99606|nr:LOW QUALITY PROTEIN: WUSCHEL-related homeobox 8-like [Erigeron canadensis]
MGSSNRHWPSMFKSKPTHHHHHHQWHAHGSTNLISCHRSPYSSGNEERSPDPKPRWNPKPEQIRILESIFNSGTVNPPREEIRKIREQLQEYGQVGDANVFYWFQNRKSRTKQKNRHTQKSQINHQSCLSSPIPTTSSSEKTRTKSVNYNQQPQTYVGNELFGTHEPNFCFTNSVQQGTNINISDNHHGLIGFSELGNNVINNQDQIIGNIGSKGMLLTDFMMMSDQQTGILTNNNNNISKEKMMKFSSSYNFTAPSPATTTISTVASTITNIQGATDVEHQGPAKSTVFINDVAYEVATGPLNVKEVFGDDAVLIHSYGHPVVTNECGVTLQSLQHGAFYYLVRTYACFYDNSSTIDFIHIFLTVMIYSIFTFH